MRATAAPGLSRPPAPGLGPTRAASAVLAVLIVAFLAVVSPAPAVAAESDDIAALVNQERWAAGLLGLNRNANLDAVASAWAQQMASDNAMYHNPNAPDQIPPGWQAWGENVARGYASGASMHTAWMNSPGHRANVLGDFTDIGVAFLSAGGTTWGVQVFAKYPGSPGVAPPAPGQPAPGPPAPAPGPPAPPPAPAAPPEPARPAPFQPAPPGDAPTGSPTEVQSPPATTGPTAPPTPSPTVATPEASSPAAAPTASSPRDAAPPPGIPISESASGTWPTPVLWAGAGIAAVAAAAVAAILLVRARGPVRSVRGRRRARR